MSVDEYEQQVRQALAQLPLAQVAQAHQAVEEALQLYGQIGSQQPEFVESATALQGAVQQLVGIHGVLGRVQSLLNGYLASIGKASAVETSGAPRPTRPAPAPKSTGLSEQQVEEMRGKLPAPVPKPNSENKKTHGQWVDAAGNVQTVASGEDERSAAAWKRLQEAGLPPTRKPVITTHVEAKVAAEMIASGQRHAELVINNRPCVGPLGCDSLLPVMLPEGYSVTVYGPDGYKQTFEGGEEW